MTSRVIKFGIAIISATLLFVADSHAQFGHRGYRGRGGYYGGGPRVSIGIGSFFGFGRFGGFFGGPNVGVSIMLPPIIIGERINDLPPGARRVYYGGVPYYYRNNVYYIEGERGGYEVVQPPLGASVERIPAAARKRVIDGETYYEYNGTYYMQDYDGNNGYRTFIVVGRNGRLNTNEALRERDASREDRNYNNEDRNYRSNDESYNNSPRRNNEIVVRNANRDYDNNNPQSNNSVSSNNRDEVYNAGPQIGDRFDQLPRNSRTITVAGKTQYESPSGTRYVEVNENGRTVYEVVKTK